MGPTRRGPNFLTRRRRLAGDDTVASIAADGIAVTEVVAERLGKSQVVLLGLSFGSVVGLDMVRARPDLFVAYVGTGLFVHRDDGRSARAPTSPLPRARTGQRRGRRGARSDGRAAVFSRWFADSESLDDGTDTC